MGRSQGIQHSGSRRGDELIYRFIWEKLPGPLVLKVTSAIALLGLFVALLFLVVFPWVDLSFFAPPTVGG